MKLIGSSRSPFVRKVIVTAKEIGIADRIELVPVVVSFTRSDPIALAHNPLGQIPTLVLDGGGVVIDSLVICEYLDATLGGHRLLGAAGAARWDTLHRHALAQGLTETLMKLFGERKRSGEPHYAAAFAEKARRVFPALEAMIAKDIERPFDLGDIALGCALSYADFRTPQIDWRAGNLALVKRFEAIRARPSFRESELSGSATE